MKTITPNLKAKVFSGLAVVVLALGVLAAPAVSNGANAGQLPTVQKTQISQINVRSLTRRFCVRLHRHRRGHFVYLHRHYRPCISRRCYWHFHKIRLHNGRIIIRRHRHCFPIYWRHA